MCWKHDPWPGVEVGTHLLRQEVDPNGVFVWMGPQFNLRQHLVGEGVAHHKARVAHGTAQVDQPALSQHDDATPILQPVAVHLQVGIATVRAGGATLPMSTSASLYLPSCSTVLPASKSTCEEPALP